MLRLFAFVVLAFLSTESAAQGFQGLRWGATERQIEAKFPGQVQTAPCTEGEAYFAKLQDRVCDHPMINQYDVAEVPFRVNFALDRKTRGLAEVVLFYSDRLPATADQKAGKRRAVERHAALHEALVVRYGRRTSGLDLDRGGLTQMMARWITQDNEIELSSTYSESSGGEGHEDHQIWYKPRRGKKDASKL